MDKTEKKPAAGKRAANTAAAPAASEVKPEAASAPIKPKWDDSAMQTAYANVCNVLGTREEITLLFGTNQAWQAGAGEVNVRLTQRIVLTPYTAKRLAQMLDQGIREYEQRFGEIKLS